eukprot:CAMPEP_0196574868 /NCGR_PEP_ID=MMETSP1081-20130531/4486_2 /TAXON_ID=36882 /ORGANISM="Pyramimonas amylifera, Strain CCMP720" /LENGTH=155 /DNA_ID=CAMNT_0041893009 /DNA_START=239 /DNA_END=706 /DNA_ORIENTATION=-
MPQQVLLPMEIALLQKIFQGCYGAAYAWVQAQYKVQRYEGIDCAVQRSSAHLMAEKAPREGRRPPPAGANRRPLHPLSQKGASKTASSHASPAPPSPHLHIHHESPLPPRTALRPDAPPRPPPAPSVGVDCLPSSVPLRSGHLSHAYLTHPPSPF